MPIEDALRNLYESLELPGKPSDYHFSIQGCADAIWSRSKKDSSFDEEIEKLCWLDIHLIEARPEAASRQDENGKRRFFSIKSFHTLINLFEKRGRLDEALTAAEMAVEKYQQCNPALLRIRRNIGIASGKPFKREVFIPAKIPSQHPNGALYTGSDWGFRATEPDGPHAGSVAHWYYWWTESNQTEFESIWTEEANRIADNLADDYGFGWPWVIGEHLAAKSPMTFQELERFSARINDGAPNKLHASAAESIASWGAFQTVRKRRTWHEPSAAVCPVCSKEFWNGDVSAWGYKKFGPARYCMDCCLQSRNGNPKPSWTRNEIIESIRKLSSSFSVIPQQQFAYYPIPYQGSQDVRDDRMRSLVNMPNIQTIKDVLEQDDWLAILRASGLVGETWRPSRGTWCYANDGHKCRSLLEKSIDDWFTSKGIEHECEPRWPYHPELNPSRAKKADWALKDGTFIECAGMMEDPKYVSKITAKRRLAAIAGIKLVIITPVDISRLDELFSQQQ